MATWITHLRIAEKLLEHFDFNRDAFLIGNLAPDCNRHSDDFWSFEPPKEKTHYLDPDGIIRPEVFIREHLDYRADAENISFTLGYYSHLLTDYRFSQDFRKLRKEKPEIYDRLSEDRDFIWVIKRDWYGLDFEYLRENKDNIFTEFSLTKEVKRHLDFFPEDIMNAKLKYIKEYYLNKENEIFLDRYTFRSKEENERFIQNTYETVLLDIKKITDNLEL